MLAIIDSDDNRGAEELEEGHFLLTKNKKEKKVNRTIQDCRAQSDDFNMEYTTGGAYKKVRTGVANG